MEGHSDSDISSNSDDDDNGHAKAKMPGQVFQISHTQIGYAFNKYSNEII
jgi:hypothetical protein